MISDESRFVDIMDRYLEVSNVYNQQMTDWKRAHSLREPTERIERLITLLESVDLKEPVPSPTIMSKEAKGQNIALTPEVLRDTQRYQEVVLERFAKGSPGIKAPRNRQRLEKVLKLPPEQFLASFHSVSYAWDILVELASISVLPDSETLASRDTIYMHCVELEVHLSRLVAQSRLSKGRAEVQLSGKMDVSELYDLQRRHELVNRLVEDTIPQDPKALIDEAMRLLEDIDGLPEWMNGEAAFALEQLRSKERNFTTLLDDGCTMATAQRVANRLASFGLSAGFCVWFSNSRGNREARSALRKNMLFCTRILLDEARWQVGLRVAEVARRISQADNRESFADDPNTGTYMLMVNGWLCQKRLGEDISEDVRAWDTTGIHPRYDFLKTILLEDFASSADLASALLRRDQSTGVPNMCMDEFLEWPVLEEFRTSPPGIAFIQSHANSA